jgi:hypothetical protein
MDGARGSRMRATRVVCFGAAVAALAAVGGIPSVPGVAAARAGAPGTILQIFHRSPVLVRAGERVRIPVDVVCARGGAACRGQAGLAVRESGRGWRSWSAASAEGLQFDLTAPVGRAGGGGVLAYRLTARGPGGRVSTLPEAGALHLYVAGSMEDIPVAAVPFGRVRGGRTVLYLPWGSGPGTAGLAPGNESATVGPSSFDVDRAGRIHLVDPLHHRVAVFGDGRLVEETVVAVPPRTDIAVAAGGAGTLASEAAAPGGRTVTVRAVGASGRLGPTVPLGRAGLAELRTNGASAVAHLLPLDAWVPAERGAGSGRLGLVDGRPLPGGGLLLSSVVGDSVRLGRVRGGRVVTAVELRFHAALGDLALAEAVGRGFLAVVHLTTSRPAPADQYQVVRVRRDGSVSSFAVASRAFAETMPLSRFRLGKDGQLYQLATSPDGVRIVRYGIGGTR